MTSSRHGPLPEYGNYDTCCLLIHQETVEAAQAVSDHKFRLCDISFIAQCMIIVSLGISTKLRKFISYLCCKFCHKKKTGDGLNDQDFSLSQNPRARPP